MRSKSYSRINFEKTWIGGTGVLQDLLEYCCFNTVLIVTFINASMYQYAFQMIDATKSTWDDRFSVPTCGTNDFDSLLVIGMILI